MAEQYVYLAVGRTDTRIFRFDPVQWDVQVYDKVATFPDGYASMGRLDDRLYALSKNNLVIIDLEKGGVPDTQFIQEFEDQGWFCGDVTPGGKTLFACAGPGTPVYEIDLSSATATAGNVAGGGRWDDWAYHPVDGRLYGVEGDNGDLLYFDESKSPVKQLLKTGVFPPAERSASGGRKSYSAVFFSEDGMFYAIDSKGNANALDLTASSASQPITPDRIDASHRLSNTPLPVDDLEVMNAAGIIAKITPLDPPVVTEPHDHAQSEPNQVIKGTVTADEGIDAVKVFEVIDDAPRLLGPAILTGTGWEYRPGQPWPEGEHTVQAVAYIGRRDSKPATVTFTVVPVAPPVIKDPKDTTTVDVDQVISGTMADGVDKVSLSEGDTALGNAALGTGTWTYASADAWSEGEHIVQAVAHKGDRESRPAIVHFTAKDPNLKVTQHHEGHWKKVWDKDPYIYSFTLTVQAKRTRVTLWTISFDVPANTTVDPDWAARFAFTVVSDGSNGTVELQNQDPKQTIDPGSPLPLNVQVLFPGENTAYETLGGLSAHEGN
ncbi:Ig-like domain-containing protein [Streptomyces violascens]|uniref:Uncharacterized protein n=1 Tax=Streptomyces violascens TaxID=67381 RepID=A0ABQ3QRX6_9ACTN|nr:hypothetical protein [Streptomyces violascens]GGT84587.1 hypothetical protein GCM10010289_00100 [Streptomyces violascens]GHI40032.1 hypothetical protein Sviol_44400 [Streptomyces violascens]